MTQWNDLKDCSWIHEQAKAAPHHEPCDGMIMCKSHHGQFNSYAFFIHFFPDVRLICLWFRPNNYSKQIHKFMFINYSSHQYLQQFHSKSIMLDIKEKWAPFPSLLMIHEMHICGFHPFQPVVPTIPNDMPWQDWILLDQVFDNTSDSFKHDHPPLNHKYSCHLALWWQHHQVNIH